MIETAGGTWMAGLVLLPLCAGLLAFLLRGWAPWMGVATALANGFCVAGLVRETMSHGPLRYSVGGWGAPLGIDWRADGLTLWMLVVTALIGFGISVYGAVYFSTATTKDDEPAQRHQCEYFWPLWLFLWSALNALFLSDRKSVV